MDSPPAPPIDNPLRSILTSTSAPVEWLVEDCLPQGVLVCFAGDRGTGKSSLCYHLAFALASGVPFLNLFPTPTPGRVLYFDQENSRPDRDEYLRWAWKGVGSPFITDMEQRIYPCHFQLGGPAHTAEGKGWWDTAKRLIDLTQPSLIVFDTANPCFGTSREEDNAEASRTIEAIRRLMRLTTPTASAIVLKHLKVGTGGETKKARGATTWESAPDAVLYLTRGRGRPPLNPDNPGLRNTHLEPGKVRAFGLKYTVDITPTWLENGGLKLTGTPAVDNE